MTMVSPAPAEAQLRDLTQQLTQWRQSRTTPRGRIPQPLGAQAGARSHVLPLARVATQLGLTPQTVKRRGGGPAAGPAPLPARGTFVAVEAPAGQTPTAAVELQRTAGARDAHHLAGDHPCAGSPATTLFGAPLLRQLPPHSRIFLALAPVDCRTGIEGRAALWRQALGETPLGGAVYVCRNRAGPTLTLLVSDGQGLGLGTNRLARGRFPWWPPAPVPSVRRSARALTILLGTGDPDRAQRAPAWRQGASGGPRAGGEVHGNHAAGLATTACRCSWRAPRYSTALTPACTPVAITLVSRLAIEARCAVAENSECLR